MLSSKIWNAGLRSPMNQLINSFRSIHLQANSSVSEPNKTQTTLQTNESVIEKVNNQIAQQGEGRLFAVVHLAGKQFKITTGDIILVEGYWPPNIGDKIRLDKVLVAGGNDFSLIGRPLVQPGLVDVQATVIEKTLTHTKVHFKKKRRKQYVRFNFQRQQNTMIMINSINMTGRVNENVQNENPIRIF
ncbi:hypothetical protein HA402_002864 [Bradysia odoriphaga]|nr:hypothetical protein HA402_002864 [Bradysia odoriphaga]